MRIGMVTACYKPVINGVTRMVALYKQYLEQAGHEVTIFTLGEAAPAGDEPGVVRSPGLPLGQTGYYFGVRYTRPAQNLLAQMDILHCHHLLMSVELAHRYAHCPIVYTNHTRYDLYAAAYSHLPLTTTRALLRQVWPALASLGDVVIAPSASVKEVLKQFGIHTPIEVIPNGIDLNLFYAPTRPRSKSDLSIPETSPLLAFVGRLATEKNLETLLDQFKQVHDQAKSVGHMVHLMLVGDGPLQRKLPGWLAEKQLSGIVHLMGAVPYDEVANWLAAADLFISASVSEVHPLTIIEAMAAGLPVVGVSSPGLVDTVQPGITGVLVDQPEKLAEATLALIRDEPMRQTMSAAARQASQQYDIHYTIEQTLALYARLLQNKQAKPGRRPIMSG